MLFFANDREVPLQIAMSWSIKEKGVRNHQIYQTTVMLMTNDPFTSRPKVPLHCKGNGEARRFLYKKLTSYTKGNFLRPCADFHLAYNNSQV